MGRDTFPGASYDAWKTTEPELMPSVSDVCTQEQDHDAYALWKDLRDYRDKYGRQALADLVDEALA